MSIRLMLMGISSSTINWLGQETTQFCIVQESWFDSDQAYNFLNNLNNEIKLL